MSDKILWFRDPYAFLKDQVLACWFEEQETDQNLFDVIDALEREKAMEIFHILDIKLSTSNSIDPQELQELLLNEYVSLLKMTPRTVH